MRKLDLIVIHCAATPNGKHYTVSDIDKWHKARGFDRIGYHYVIYIDGTIHEGRPIDTAGAHATGYNARSIGICLIGTDKFTLPQWNALKQKVQSLKDEYYIYKIAGHNEIPKVVKICPGFSVKDWRHNDMKPLEGHILADISST